MILPGYFNYARRIGYRRKWIVTILMIQLGAVMFEGISIGMILPILQSMNPGEAGASSLNSQLLDRLKSFASGYGIEVNLATLLIFAFSAIILRQVFMYWREVYLASVQYELVRTVRNTGFERFLHAGFAYHDKVRSGDFVNELTTELERATGAMTSGATLMGYLILCASYVVIVISLSPTLTLAALFTFALAAVLLFRIVRRIRECGQLVTLANQDMSSFLVERLKAVRLVRLSGVEDAEQKALAEHTLDQRNHQFNLRKIMTLFSVLIEPVVVGISFILLYFSTTAFMLEFETILLFFFILLRLVPVIKEVFLTRQSYISLLASIETLVKRLSEMSEFKDPKGGSRKLKGLEQSIVLRNVTFHYGEDSDAKIVPALEELNLEIPARRMTALVGPSGAGKSTLVDLLPRLREIQEGEILFDGITQKDFDTVSLRRAIAFAPQQPQMFDVTVKEHIRYGLLDATMVQVREAARLAQVDGFIDALPEGYDTKLGEAGSRLSGGQRQRLDLARALVRRAPILVLDEPTANLDAEAEFLFRAAIDKIRAVTNMTIIIIGHRFSTVMGADQIVVLKAGKVNEIGNHQALMKSGGWYASAFAQQQGDTQLESAS